MDVIRLYRDFGIEHVTEGQHKHARYGWVNTECPFCHSDPGHEGYHLGWNIEEEYFFCWRCGWKPPVKTLSELTHTSINQVLTFLPAYGINRTVYVKRKKDKLDFQLPSGVGPLKAVHKNYLRSRGFNPKTLEKRWGLLGAGPVSVLKTARKTLNYKYRIIIPFNWNSQMVSFDSRFPKDKHPVKYQACPAEMEIIEHKKILYGNQEEWIDTGIGLEGPTDVWRIGPVACATSGIEYTHAQVKLIARTFKRFAVVFDDEPQAQKQAQKLVADLRFRGLDSWSEKVKGDPGGLKPHEAKDLRKYIISKAKRR